MPYIQVQWNHSYPNEPVQICGEYDAEGWETRKLEVFRDGSVSYANAHQQVGTSGLAEVKLSSINEINADPQFSARAIKSSQFERLWRWAANQPVHAPHQGIPA